MIKQLPEHYPTPTQALHGVLQKRKVFENSIAWMDSVYSIDNITGNNSLQLIVIATINCGRNS